MAWFISASLLSGCLYAAPIAPHPTVVYAPHPDHADATLEADALAEAYTASPDVDPDGLGALDFVWEQSYATLLVWPLGKKLQELSGIAYARTEQEQRQVLSATKLLLEDYVAFYSFLIGDFAQLLELNYFKPEGIYLINDQGEKYYPFFAETGEWVVPSFGTVTGDFGTSHFSKGMLVFPGQAIQSDTKSISLFLATPRKRARFTWVFDPSYEAPAGRGVGRPGHWPAR